MTGFIRIRKTEQAADFIATGILILSWLNMSFTGDWDHDFDTDSITAAIAGNYSIHDLFLSPDGLQMLALLAAGTIYNPKIFHGSKE